MDFPLYDFVKSPNIQLYSITPAIKENVRQFEEAIQMLLKLLLGEYKDLGAGLYVLTESYEINLDEYKKKIKATLDYWIRICNKLYEEGKYLFQVKSVSIVDVSQISNEVNLTISIETDKGIFTARIKV